MPRHCIVCGNDVPQTQWEPPNQPRYDCRVCGKFRLSEYVAQRMFEFAYQGGAQRPYVAEDHHLVSAVIRERYEQAGRREIFIPDLDELRAAAVPLDDPFAAVDRILLHVVRSARRVGEAVELDPEFDYPIAFARDADEFQYYIDLGTQIGFLAAQDTSLVRPSAGGWERVRQLRLHSIDPQSAFVAMDFSPEKQVIFDEGIEPALRSTGFRSIRLDRVEYNGKIQDRIIADIRKSLLVVAEFTGHRQNVYFEAGFALGLGRHVIWTCRDSEIDDAHFDTRQYNHVIWSDTADLRERLQNRIEATIPRADRASDTGTFV